MQDKAKQPTLILFAKSPVPGRVKTRLMPELDEQQAAQVATFLIEHTVQLALNNWQGPVALHAWPDPDHVVFKSLSATHDLVLASQSQGDLGEKMYNALRVVTDEGLPAAIMGCDVPHCPGRLLKDACDLLHGGRDIIGPTSDGGYYLIGLQHPHAEIFKDVSWGSNSVMQRTLAAGRNCGVHFTQLASLQDIDRFEDLKRVVGFLPDLRKWIK